MGCPGTVDQHGSPIAGGKPKAAFGKGDIERAAGIRRLPSRERGSANVGYRDIGTFGLRAFSRCLRRDGTATAKKSGSFHRIGDVGTPILPESSRDGSVVLAPDERQAVFEFGDAADLLATRVLMREIGNLSCRLHERVDDVVVATSGFEVLDTAALNLFKPEFPLVLPHEDLRDSFGICTGRRIDMDMMHRAIRSAMTGGRNEFSELPAKVGGGEVACVENKNFLALPGHQVAGQSWATCASRRAGDHDDKRTTRRPTSACTARSSARAASASA